MRRRCRPRATLAIVSAVVSAIGGGVAGAAPVKIFREASAQSFLAGELDGVAVADEGALTLAPSATRVAAIEEPYAFALAPLPDGWAVGTSNDGRVLAVGKDGAARVLYDAAESEIFALASDADGTVYAGSSPDGKVYRVTAKGGEVVFDPEETYIWALAPAGGGALWVATGSPGRLYRVARDGSSATVWDGGAAHVRSLLPLPGGDLLFGTAGDGRVLRWHAGQVRTVYDSELTEVAALARAPDGTLWAALLASEASFVDLAPRGGGANQGDADAATTVVVVDGSSGSGSRPTGSRQPRAQLVRLAADGTAETAWSSADETIFALAADVHGVWMGTGLDGHLYRVTGDEARVVRDFDEKQVVGLSAAEAGVVALTTNGAALWRLSSARESEGTYTSSALDAGQVARFGVFRWRGELPEGSEVLVSYRTGYASEPDETWSDWSEERAGREVALAPEARGRFVQYRLRLRAKNGAGPRVVETQLSYRQQNLRPTIDRFEALDPGQILVPAAFNPAEQSYEPASPNREGIFTTLRPANGRDDRGKRLWRTGWQTLDWSASDPNGDELRYRVEVRPEGERDGWLEMAADLEESHWVFDATVLPDGLYRFRLTATDTPGNEGGESLTSVAESGPVAIDHTPPELHDVRRRGETIELTVYDAMSPLRQAEVSIDGSAWRSLGAEDGLLDGQDERLRLDGVPKDARLVLLRLVDGAFNVRTYEIEKESR